MQLAIYVKYTNRLRTKIFQALFLLFVTMATAVEIESNGAEIEKKQEKRGISSLGYGYRSSGLGYDSGAIGGFGGYPGGSYGTPVSYNHYTAGGIQQPFYLNFFTLISN